MRSATFGSARKFWPSALDGRRPCRSSKAVQLGPTRWPHSETGLAQATPSRKAATAFSEVTLAISSRDIPFSRRKASPTSDT